MLFLYKNVLGRELGIVDSVRAKRPARLPVVLVRSEVQRLFAHLDGVVLVVATLLYGAGFRLLECLSLRVKDVDFESSEITVRDGKGQKDRVTMLPASVKQPLLDHLDKRRQLYLRDLRADSRESATGTISTKPSSKKQSPRRREGHSSPSS